ncbi:hypothetical protein BD560DRAFT_105719 [Blakeslea trispora]|nr:hypothetical protein BD560DRAFT_105719 [Blakeslea trispora]
MLPQFGFIVAQAGADSHPTTPNNNNNNTSALGSTSSASHLTKPYPPPSTTSSSSTHDPYYYRHTRSPPPPSLLPPPLPYMYSNNNSTTGGPLPLPSGDYYHGPPRYQPPSIYDSPTKQQANTYRPLQPLPPPPPPQAAIPLSSNNKWHSDTAMMEYHPSNHWHDTPSLYQAPTQDLVPPTLLPPPPTQSILQPPPPPPPPIQHPSKLQQKPSTDINLTSKVVQGDEYMYDDPSLQRWPGILYE